MSPADKAGIQEKDIILEWNGKKITAEKTIQDFLEDSSVGATITLSIFRRGRRIDKKIILTERR